MFKQARLPGVAAVAVIALVGAYLGLDIGSGGGVAGAAPSDGEFSDVGLFVPVEPTDDGFNHLLVELRLTYDVLDRSATALGDLDLSRLDPDSGVASLWPDGDGNVWARYPDGTSYQITGEIPQFADAAGLLVTLESDANVVQARRVDEDTIAVTTTYDGQELGLKLGLVVLTDEPVTAFDNDPYFSYQWGLENTGQGSGYLADADIDITDARAESTGGDGVIVAVLDSGVDFAHPDLAGAEWTNAGEICGNGVDDDGNGYVDDCRGWDFVNDDNAPWDGNNHFHGTHVFGIIAARRDNVGIVGVAPLATIMDLRVLDIAGSGRTSGFAPAIRYAVDNGAKVINMSLGSNPGASRLGFGSVEQAIDYARANGVVVVAAAGNSNVNIDILPVWPASFAMDYENVMAIASTDYADQRSSFSNYGNATVTIGAPGSRILSTMPNAEWSYASGTSMAAPMVAGGLAVLTGDLPDVVPVDIINRVVDGADPLDSLAGLLANPRRLNVGNLYAEPLIPAVHLEATGLDGLMAGEPITARLHLTINDAWAFTGQHFTWEARLLTSVNGSAYGVVGHDVSVDGVATTTDGEALIHLSGRTSLVAQPSLTTTGVEIEIGTTLPTGVYALIVEAVPENDLDDLEAPQNVLFFTVTDPSLPTTVPPTTVPTTSTTAYEPVGAPGPNPTTTVEPVPTTLFQPVGGTTSTTSLTVAPTTTAFVFDPQGPTTTGATTPTGAPVTTTTFGQPVASTLPVPTSATDLPVDTTPVVTSSTLPSLSTTTTTGPTVVGTTTTTSTPVAPTTTMVPVESGEWSLRLISPNEAHVSSSGLVSLYGTFPRVPYVWFGDSPAVPVFSTSSYLLVTLPRVANAGLVDVSLRIGGETVLIAPDAFRFIDPLAAPTTTISTPESSTTTQPTAGPPQEFPFPPGLRGDRPTFAVGEPVTLDNGLTVAPIIEPASPTGSIPVSSWPTRSCTGSSCQAYTI